MRRNHPSGIHTKSTYQPVCADINSIFDAEDDVYNADGLDGRYELENAEEDDIVIEYIKCPACEKIGITIYRPCTEETFRIAPRTARKSYPDYIPKQIRKDYEEACLIADLSPKASATLSRRCLQGMIRDFFKVKKDSLCDEICAIADLPGMSANQVSALNALRKIGNIGAHPERDINLIVDVDEDEANLMISLIEFFIQNWYIQRHDEEEMMNKIINTSQVKDEIRKSHRAKKMTESIV